MIKDSNIIIISGPSGAGKSSLCDRLFKQVDNIYFSISSTTRAKRDGEIDGVHYHFISQEEFESGIKNNLFLEWARVHNNYYGTQKIQVDNALKEGKIVLFDVDIQGQESIKGFYPNATSIFITTPNKATLEQRLKSRALDSMESIDTRLSLAYNEMQAIDKFDFIIINDDFDKSFDGFLSIIKSLYFKNSSYCSKNLLATWK
ncbi:guanylate kinase [Helicobacter sp. MIT 99-5507]|uniref:guanylate kinase n=1 Tax=Helicobacter sp. MIT 99-5507 TaxID=152489 RepID=UPI000E1F267D|nr:guanylate kinase [Helicobacter sp. MIT 99-5507]RDU57983.1 guanylate kinase [Helicobacter sp. MIT 99-5507]